MSSVGGFEINLYKKNKLVARGHTLFHDTASYAEMVKEIDVLRFKIFSSISSFVLFFWMFNRFSHVNIQKLILFYIIIFNLNKGIVFVGIAMKLSQTFKKWHGCEHKLIAIYGNGLPRTKDSMSMVRKESKNCSTIFLARKFSLTLTLTILLFLTNATIIQLLILIMLYEVISIYLSLILQYFFTTAEPDEEQVAQALELAKSLDFQLIEKGILI